METTIYFLIVLYNKKLDKSISYQTLLKWRPDAKVLVYDNSDKIEKPRVNEFSNVEMYLGDGNNHGLAYAYNRTIRELQTACKNEKEENIFLTILDDDTEITEEYLTHMEQQIDSEWKTTDIFMPIVYSGEEIMSPFNVYYNLKVMAVCNILDIHKDKISAINSGLVLKLSMLEKVQYDEGYFLDCVDHAFFREARRNNMKMKIVEDAVLRQKYSRNEECDLATRLRRFRIYVKDFKRFCSISLLGKIFYYLSLFKMATKYTIQYHSLSFYKAMHNKD